MITPAPLPLHVARRAPPAEPAALAATLDPDAVEEAVGVINGLYDRNGFASARAVGTFVLAWFFGGDREGFHAGRKRHVSYRALAKHPALSMSPTQLWTSVAIVEHAETFPPELIERIPLSWHRAVLSLPTVLERRELLEEVLDTGRGYRLLVARVAERLGTTRRTGRPRKPALNPLFSAMRTVPRDLDRAHLPTDGLRALPPADLEALREAAEKLLDAAAVAYDRILEATEPA